MVCTLLSGENKSKEEYFIPHENYMEFKFPCLWIKFYWNIATHLFTYCLCFHAVVAELSNWDRNCGPQTLKYVLSGLLGNKFASFRTCKMEAGQEFNYSGISVLELHSSRKAVWEAICSKTELFFPLETNIHMKGLSGQELKFCWTTETFFLPMNTLVENHVLQDGSRSRTGIGLSIILQVPCSFNVLRIVEKVI